MRRIRVDFNNTISGVVPALNRNETLTQGQHVIVYDDDTDDYEGEVVGFSDSGVVAFIAVKPNPIA